MPLQTRHESTRTCVNYLQVKSIRRRISNRKYHLLASCSGKTNVLFRVARDDAVARQLQGE